ncbi:hypothetical protein SCH4B_0308 [Ruegeria sp. TrichCH4B]|nr:hypothetical protein SCH4B_0308 [Ruegeria sp. TrichCH4B]
MSENAASPLRIAVARSIGKRVLSSFDMMLESLSTVDEPAIPSPDI